MLSLFGGHFLQMIPAASSVLQQDGLIDSSKNSQILLNSNLDIEMSSVDRQLCGQNDK